jgi:glycosyltransferase involved in cell wall biosynthesis
LYLSLSYLPSRRASSVQVMKMCAALAAQGHEVTLVGKRSDEPSAAGMTVHGFYGVPESFTVERLARPKGRGGGLVHAAAMMRSLWTRRRSAQVVYCRDLLGAVAATRLGLPVVFEGHALPSGAWQRRLWQQVVTSPHCVGLVLITDALRRDVAAAGLGAGTMVVAPDAADPPEATAAGPRRRPLGRPPHVGYVGNLYPGRGIELVLEIAALLPGCHFDLVGGSDGDIARWKERGASSNVTFHGFLPPSKLQEKYQAIDVLLLPHPRSEVRGATGGADISRWTSPMKMFEYMASGAPMIASDLPVLREVLRDGENALIAPAGEARAWQAVIERLLADDALRASIADQALRDLTAHYTWPARAARVMTALGLS